MAPLKEEIARSIAEIEQAFTGCPVTATPDGEGGAFVVVDALDPGERYVQRATWCGFRITFQYPYADVYPHFVRADLSRVDGQPLGEATSMNSFQGQPAIQLSRRSNRRDAAMDTAARKLLRVLEWLRSRP